MPESRPAQAWGGFQIHAPQVDWNRGRVILTFDYDRGPEFTEEFHFPVDAESPSEDHKAVIGGFIRLLGQLAGVSYYKLGMPDQIDLQVPASADRCRFLEDTYRHGLAELRFRNDLPLPLKVTVQAAAPERTAAPMTGGSHAIRRVLVAMGGGKDSVVAAEMLRKAGYEVTLGVVGGAEVITSVIQCSGLPHLSVNRHLDASLMKLNQGSGWNGHVPVTAINSAALLTLAAWRGFDAVVFANERSANEATVVTASGERVNHQYSKSLAFESALQDVVAGIHPGLHYFSLLRPLGELGILQRFSEYPSYHPVFSSCNRNFHREGSRIEGRWCGDCPKCRFTYLGLAVFLDRQQLDAIFPAPLLDRADQIDGYRALAALGIDKPFECVGTVAEVRSAMGALDRRSEWSRSAVISALRPALESAGVEPLQDQLGIDRNHRIPPDVAEACFCVEQH